MSESDSDSDIERCSSLKSIPEVFDRVPANVDFKFSFFGSQCSKSGTKLIFPLKAGKELPYLTQTITKKGRGIYQLRYQCRLPFIFYFQVFPLKFSKSLVPSVEGYVGKKEEDWWIFRETGLLD